MQKRYQSMYKNTHQFQNRVTYRKDRKWTKWNRYKGGFNSIHNVKHYKRFETKNTVYNDNISNLMALQESFILSTTLFNLDIFHYKCENIQIKKGNLKLSFSC